MTILEGTIDYPPSCRSEWQRAAHREMVLALRRDIARIMADAPERRPVPALAPARKLAPAT